MWLKSLTTWIFRTTNSHRRCPRLHILTKQQHPLTALSSISTTNTKSSAATWQPWYRTKLRTRMHNKNKGLTSCKSRSEWETNSDLKTKCDCARNCHHSLLIKMSHCQENRGDLAPRRLSQHWDKSHNKVHSTAPTMPSQCSRCKKLTTKDSRKFTARFKLSRISQTWRQEEESLKTEWTLS